MPTTADTTTSVETDLTSASLDRSFDDVAIDDGRSVIENHTYSVRMVDRSGNSEFTTIDDIRFTDEVNAAQNLQVRVPPEDFIKNNMDSYLGGSLELYINSTPAFAGDIVRVEIDEEQKDSFTIIVQNPGRKLVGENINITPDNDVLQDTIAKIVDKYNTYDAEMADLFGTTDVTLSNMTEVGGSMYAVDDGNSTASATFSNVGTNASDIVRIYWKAYTGVSGSITVESTENGTTYTDSQSYSDMDKNIYGEWREFKPEEITTSSYDLKFEFEGDSYLFDWIALTENELQRDTIPPTVKDVGTDEFLYSYSGSELNTNELSLSGGVKWDSGNSVYRTVQKGDWYVVKSDDTNTVSDSDATDGIAWTGGSETLGVSQTYNLVDTIQDWRLYARVKTVTSGDWNVTITVDGESFSTTLSEPDPADGYVWDTVANNDFTTNWPADLSGTTEIQIDQNSSSAEVLIGSFFLAHGTDSTYSFNYTFDNTLHASGGHLDSPHRWGTGTVEFDGATSDSNITEAALDSTMNNTSDPVESWGSSQRVDTSAPFPEVANAQDRTDTFPYAGVSHQTHYKLTAAGAVRDTDSPREGYQRMEISDYSVNISSDDLEVLYSQSIDDNRLAAISSIADDSTHFFRWEGNLCKIFRSGDLQSDASLLRENTTSSVDIEDTYSSVEVIGANGVTSGVVTADSSPAYVTRHKEIRDRDLTTKEDCQRRAFSFLNENSDVKYTGEATILPSFAPVGEEVPGTLFSHGNKMFIEKVRYGLNRSSITFGEKKRFSKEFINAARRARSSEKQDTS